MSTFKNYINNENKMSEMFILLFFIIVKLQGKTIECEKVLLSDFFYLEKRCVTQIEFE